jgi:hypothetical protein
MRDNIISIEARVGLLGLIADGGFARNWENFDNHAKLTVLHKSMVGSLQFLSKSPH